MSMGSLQAQRSNAVGNGPAYLPELNPGMQGGNTYTGNSSEPTLSDYENFFGPSARDIKTDMQRFKRHGRWHLPDVLKGVNPWLTDRIDGLITDATNSPFTTRILPYMYKEEVDGKMKWNVWSFDEGMASRVPYESAARTLTQSKNSFSAYMVRQGMAIVLEHNFMMSPKGRENFKNQLNQLIGSIQYTNDLDVHMALILAPSYQKTMREKYLSVDKASSQICREFCDLFGMMQKNVNALDILIEEAKAILKTWGGPMPDFLLCNSKLTFQMTMTPEKTNYFTQGADGAKRLKQGPDLPSYRGLSIIHSRSFAMEAGQHPRDILRRRVRTAEYYRIPPNPKNKEYDFEFYNEERDTWFSMSFAELLRCAQHNPSYGSGGDGSGGYGENNPSLVNRVFHLTGNTNGNLDGSMLGFESLGAALTPNERTFLDFGRREFLSIIETPLFLLYGIEPVAAKAAFAAGGNFWQYQVTPFDMGIKHIPPTNSQIWEDWEKLVQGQSETSTMSRSSLLKCMVPVSRLTPKMAEDLFNSLEHITLNHPFKKTLADPGTADWFSAFTFYQEVYKRFGYPMDAVSSRLKKIPDDGNIQLLNIAREFTIIPNRPYECDISNQFLSPYGATGSVNHALHSPGTHNTKVGMWTKKEIYSASSLILTYEILEPLLREYMVDGRRVSGIDYMCSTKTPDTKLHEIVTDTKPGKSPIRMSIQNGGKATDILTGLLGGLKKVDTAASGGYYLGKNGINTWPMGFTTRSHLNHQDLKTVDGIKEDKVEEYKSLDSLLDSTHGHLNSSYLSGLSDCFVNKEHHWFFKPDNITVAALAENTNSVDEWVVFWKTIKARIFKDPLAGNPLYTPSSRSDTESFQGIHSLPSFTRELTYMTGRVRLNTERQTKGELFISAIAPGGLNNTIINLNSLFQPESAQAVEKRKKHDDIMENVEIVVIRPNIEHNMLGIIMGLGGSELGHTLWGQTELSCYDDSMHGLWGMSYKYHERAIVFNEKNLIRLWDIAYDGYNGGKDDTYVDWTDENAKNGYKRFAEATLDIGKNYRGPSMMVMAFVHDKNARGMDGQPLFGAHFKRNWPSPIVFHDNYNPLRNAGPVNETLPLDYDNIQVVDVEDFRVFNNELYQRPYGHYREKMPSFHELHKTRKTAGQSSSESETQTDSLAFQGSMRIKHNGRIEQDIQGSGHHGTDYVGVASVRAGKGLRFSGQPTTLAHMV